MNTAELILLSALLLLTCLGGVRSLGVALDPSQPTQLRRAPSGPGGKSAWIITAGDHSGRVPADQRRPQDVYTADAHRGHTLPMVSFGTGTLHPVSSASNEVHDAGDWRRPYGSGGSGDGRPKHVPPSFTVTSRPFGLGGSGQTGGAAAMYDSAGGYHDVPFRRRPPPPPETTMAWINSPDRYTSVENQRIPSYSLGCKEGQKCSYVISVPSPQQHNVAAPYDREKVHGYLSNYESILEQARNVTSQYMVQKLEPNTRFPTPMEAYQRDQQLSLDPKPPKTPTVSPPGKPTVATSVWATSKSPAASLFPTRRQQYVTMRPTYVHTSLSLGSPGGGHRQKVPVRQNTGAGQNHAPEHGIGHGSGYGSAYSSGYGLGYGAQYGSRRELPTDSESRHTAAADSRVGEEPLDWTEADRHRPYRPTGGRHPFDDDEPPQGSATTSVYPRPRRPPTVRPPPYRDAPLGSDLYPERQPPGRPLDRRHGTGQHRGVRPAQPAGDLVAEGGGRRQQAAPWPADGPRLPSGYFRGSAERDVRIRHPTDRHDSRYADGGVDSGYRGDTSNTRYSAERTQPPYDRYGTRYPQGISRRHSENDVLEPVRSGTSGYRNSAVSPFRSGGTLPPVILYRSERQLLKAAGHDRSPKQMTGPVKSSGNGAYHQYRDHRGLAHRSGPREEEEAQRGRAGATPDHKAYTTPGGVSNWSDKAGVSTSGVMKSGFVTLTPQRPRAQHQTAISHIQSGSRKPASRIPLTGKIFKAHVKSRPITFVTDDSDKNQVATVVNGKNPVSRNIGGAAIITTVEGQRKFPNILALAPENLRRNPGFHLPDWTPPPPTSPAAHNHRGRIVSQTQRGAAPPSPPRPSASEFRRVTAPLLLQDGIDVATIRPTKPVGLRNSVNALLASLLPALMGH